MIGEKIQKPWGYYIDHHRTPQLVCKTIYITPGEKISYQKHHKRIEFWFIQSGSGVFRLNDNLTPVRQGNKIIIDKLELHQIINDGQDLLIINEMQVGECSEDDIVRLEDPYNR